jgi:hypothetical protein
VVHSRTTSDLEIEHNQTDLIGIVQSGHKLGHEESKVRESSVTTHAATFIQDGNHSSALCHISASEFQHNRDITLNRARTSSALRQVLTDAEGQGEVLRHSRMGLQSARSPFQHLDRKFPSVLMVKVTREV